VTQPKITVCEMELDQGIQGIIQEHVGKLLGVQEEMLRKFMAARVVGLPVRLLRWQEHRLDKGLVDIWEIEPLGEVTP